ncbi:MAG: hypothetical protein HYZ53_18510 [Planctomycetes bacterium]|nr:hypothetical protein [Planctomycetota bacterium]
MAAPARARDFGLGPVPYHNFGAARMLVLAGVRRAYGSDWFREGAAAVLAAQQEDGSWYAGAAAEADVLETCWQLLFLARSVVPLLPTTSGEPPAPAPFR